MTAPAQSLNEASHTRGTLRVSIASVSLRKDMSAVVRAAERQGWRVEMGRGGHWKLYAPDGETIVVAASTPGARSSIDKTVARMRRYGFVWKGR